MTAISPIHDAEPCAVLTRRGLPCGSPSIQWDPGLGPVCALHAYHRRRSSQPRQHFQCRVNTADLEALDQLASAHGLTRSEAVRRLLHRLPFPRATVDAQTYRELRRIGVNVNQMAHSLNRGDAPEADVILPRLDDLAWFLEDLALKLAGGSRNEEADA